MVKVLVVGIEPDFCRTIAGSLRREGYKVLTAADVDDAFAIIENDRPDVVVGGLILPAESGITLLEEVSRRRSFLPVIMLLEQSDLSRIREIMQAGAYDFLVSPVTADTLSRAIAQAVEAKRSVEARRRRRPLNCRVEPLDKVATQGASVLAIVRHHSVCPCHRQERPAHDEKVVMRFQRAPEFAADREENRHLKQVTSGNGETFGMIGRNPALRQIYETISTTAASQASVLIEGESGTGKELIAAAFHSQSHCANQPFVRINCAAIPGELIESELFGYKKGAFTGADRDKRGLIEASGGGTLLLDEIAEMPVHLQTKLLRVLQERSLRRLGSEREIRVDFRLIASTNRDTRAAMREGRLRDDLYFRISTINIKVPPLRERLDDLALLAEYFLERYRLKYQRGIRGLSQAALTLLSRYDWPGNVRELESVIERAVLFCQQDLIGPTHLPEHLQATPTRQFKCEIPAYLTMEEIEREAIKLTLERTRNNVKKTAQILDLHRPTLYRKLKKFGIRQ
jgi:DNA-binding NtrC family response regulator